MNSTRHLTLDHQIFLLLQERGPKGATCFELISLARARGNTIVGKASETAVRDCLKRAGTIYKCRNENMPISDGATTAMRIQRYWLASVAPDPVTVKRQWVRDDLDEIIASHMRAS